MSPGHWKILLLLAALSLTFCGRDSEPELAGAGADRPLEQMKNSHPRIILTAEKLETLRPVLGTTHKWLWDRYLQEMPSMLERASAPLPEDLDRGHAGLAPDLAFAWVMTAEDSHFQAAKEYLLGLARGAEWDPANDLVHGHLLQGIALAYDWLYQSMSPEERSLVARRLGKEAEAEYQRITAGRVWYRNQYFQNHGISNFCGLAYAACALYGEDERAPGWLKICEDFFSVVFSTLPADGTSLEGLSYGAYDFEFIDRYAELALGLLGKNFYDARGLKEMPKWFLHSLLPAHTGDEWAMTFGDAPRHANWHGPEPQLFLAASKYNDTAAQWLGKHLINLEEKGLGGASFWAILWYDPKVPEADPAEFPTFHHFNENDQVMMRSSWTDPSAMLVGFKCGPFMGKVQSMSAEWDWGTNHQHPDAGSFQIFAHGQFLAIDPLYTTFKRTANHNTMLFKGKGQLGEDIVWMGVAECVHYRHYPEIVHAESTPEYDYVVGDVTRAYHPALGLKKFVRHLLFIKPDILLISDQIALDDKGVLYSYPSDELGVSGGLGHDGSGYVVGGQGEAYSIFQGVPGTYKLTANYLDNYPGEGEYSFVVDGETVQSWQSTSKDSDNHFVVSPEVKLKTGSRIAFRGSSLPGNFRLIKMTAYSEEAVDTLIVSPALKTGMSAGSEAESQETGQRVKAAAPASCTTGEGRKIRWDVQWLLHFDPEAEISEKGPGITVTLGEACLDIHGFKHMSVNGYNLDIWPVKNPHERFRQTKRLQISPTFLNGETRILTLIHARDKDAPFIRGFGLRGEKEDIVLNFDIADKTMVVRWDFEKKEVKLVKM